jgi:hypothetical protein
MAFGCWKRSSRNSTKNRRGVNIGRRLISRLMLEKLETRFVPSTIYWTGAQDTGWDNPGNWSTGSVPGAGDDVIINQAGANVVLNNFTGTPDTIHSLMVQATNVTLALQFGTLDLSGGISGAKGIFQASGAGDGVNLQAATLANADVTAGTVVTSSYGYGYGGALDGVQLDGSLNISNSPPVTIVNGLTLNGEIDGGGGDTSLSFGHYGDTAGQSLFGTGVVRLGYYAGLANNSAGVLTIGPGITMQGGSYNTSIFGPVDNQGTIQAGSICSIYDLIINEGTLAENTVGGTLSIGNAYQLTSWTNAGAISAGGNTTLNLYGSWTNNAGGIITAGQASTVTLGSPIDIDPTDPSAPSYEWTNLGSLSIGSGSSVSLGGVFTAASLSALGLDSSDTVSLIGSLDNRGAILGVGGANASWTLAGGRIYQGSVTTAAGSALTVADFVAFSTPPTLDGVQLNGTLAITGYYTSAQILNGLVLNGEIDLGASGSFTSSTLSFGNSGDTAAQALSGTGTVVFGADYNGDTLANASAGVLTIGSGITIEGGGSSNITGPIDNQGTILENTVGGSLFIGSFFASVPWTNDGTISAASGAALYLLGNWTNSAAGVITASPSSTVWLGSFVNIDPTDPSAPNYAYANLGSIRIGHGSSVYLGGVFTVASLASLGLDASDTLNLVGTLDNRGATLAVGGTNAVWTLDGGRIYQGTVLVAAGSTLVAGGFTTSTLDGVQLNGTLQITDFSSVQILHSLTLNGEIEIGDASGSYDGASLNFGNVGDTAAPAFTGSGTIVFGTGSNTDTLANLANGVLTLGPGIAIEGGANSSLSGLIDNLSTIFENTPGGTLSIGSVYALVPWINDGTITASTDTTLNLYGNWTNNPGGVITVGPASTVTLGSPVNIDPTDPTAPGYAWTNLGSITICPGAMVNLGGVFTMSSLAGMGLDNSDTYNLTGTLDNRGATLAVGGTNAVWTLGGGRIYRGTVSIAPGSTMDVIGTYSTGVSTLDGVQLNGTLAVNQGFFYDLNILNGLTLNGEIDMGGHNPYWPYTNLNFGLYGDTTAEAVTGTGTIVFGQASLGSLNNRAGTLTIGAGITIECGLSTTLQGPMDNQGAIMQTVAGGNLSIGLFFNFIPFINDGTITTASGSTLNVNEFLTNNGVLQVASGASLSIAVSYYFVPWTNNGTISAGSGTTVNLYSDWTNSASGIITVGPGSTVTLGSETTIDPTDPSAPNYVWTNEGSLRIGSGSRFNLAGVFTAATLASLGLDASDTVTLDGTLDNRGATLAVGGTNPVWALYYGRIYGGTIITAPGTALVAQFVTLDGVTLDGTLDMTQSYSNVNVLNGLTLNGEIDLGGPGGSYNSGTLNFGTTGSSTTQSLTGTGRIVFGDNYYSDYLDNGSLTPLTIGPGITVAGGQSGYIFGLFNNQGTIEETTAGGVLILYSFGDIANYDPTTGTLTGGTWEASNGGNLQLNGAPITTNAATIILSGAGSHLTTDGTTDGLAGLTTNAAGGSLTVQGGASVSSSKAVTNLGSVVVGPGGSFGAAGGYTQSSGLTVVDGALSAPNVNLNGGALRGAGNVQGNVVNAAEIDPGDSLGRLSVTGNYIQTAAGVLNVEIGGTATGAFDQLAVSGLATLGGTMNVHYVNGFVANPGDSFPVLTFGSRAGTSDFATENGLNPVSGQFLIPTYNSGNLTLTAKDSTATTATSTGSSSPFGRAVTFMATLASTGPGVGAPTGTVDFYDATTQYDLGSVALSGGEAQLTTTALPVGTQTITMKYLDDGGFLTSSASVTVAVIESAWILNASAAGALSVSGPSSLTMPGVIEVESSSATAIQASGSAKVKASAILEVGGYSISGTASLSPTPTKGIAAFSDPLNSLAAPVVNNYQGSVSLNGSQALTINPGIYGQISVSGSAKLTMSPGIYVIAGGGFTVTGSASITGTGVMIYNAGSNYNGGSGSSYGGITLSSRGAVNLLAPTTGPYAGIVFFQSRDNLRAISLGGGGLAGLGNGIVYAPGALLTITGSAQLKHAPFVVNQLQLSGSGSSTLTDGSNGNTATAGQLLAGDLEIYVDNRTGNFTAGELTAIQDAITTTDRLLVPYSVVVREVTNPALANLTIDFQTTSAAGGEAEGVLGCYDMTTAEITLIRGWRWYAGSNPSAIGADQYSFETAVTHELGHALGLGHSRDANSVMYAALPTGVVKGSLTTQDLNIGDTGGNAPDALHAAAPGAGNGLTAPAAGPLSLEATPRPQGGSSAPNALPAAFGSPAGGPAEFAGLRPAVPFTTESPSLPWVAGTGAILAGSQTLSWNSAAVGYEGEGRHRPRETESRAMRDTLEGAINRNDTIEETW